MILILLLSEVKYRKEVLASEKRLVAGVMLPGVMVYNCYNFRIDPEFKRHWKHVSELSVPSSMVRPLDVCSLLLVCLHHAFVFLDMTSAPQFRCSPELFLTTPHILAFFLKERSPLTLTEKITVPGWGWGGQCVPFKFYLAFHSPVLPVPLLLAQLFYSDIAEAFIFILV